jgi:hypothetical protein
MKLTFWHAAEITTSSSIFSRVGGNLEGKVMICFVIGQIEMENVQDMDYLVCITIGLKKEQTR